LHAHAVCYSNSFILAPHSRYTDKPQGMNAIAFSAVRPDQNTEKLHGYALSSPAHLAVGRCAAV